MNSFIEVTTLIALSLFLNNQPTQSSLEKRAVADTRRTLASELDVELPRLSFADWFGKVVGPGTGMVWQLTECGEQVEASSNATGDARACVEVNTILPNGRRVIVMIAVGTFKKGMTGAPAFHFGVIEHKGKLYPIRRLRDLQKQLSATGNPADRPAIKLPEVNMPGVRLTANDAYAVRGPVWIGEESGRPMPIEEPPLRADLAPPNATSTVESRAPSEEPAKSGEVKLLGSVSWGDAVTKVQPRYPAKAKRVNASGPVDVQVTISAEGRVIEAKATSGHTLLREAAEEAARQWVFKPATLNGAPVETQRVLTFLFKAPQ
jgi:TonB family protein